MAVDRQFSLAQLLFFVIAISSIIAAFYRGFRLIGDIGVGFLFAFIVLFLAFLIWETCFGSGKQQLVKIGLCLVLTPLVGSLIVFPQWFNAAFARKVELHWQQDKSEEIMLEITQGSAAYKNITWKISRGQLVTIQVSGSVDTIETAREFAAELKEKLKEVIPPPGYSFGISGKDDGSIFTG